MIALASEGAKSKEGYPSKPVRIVDSFAAGDPTDTVARIMGAKMGELLEALIQHRTLRHSRPPNS